MFLSELIQWFPKVIKNKTFPNNTFLLHFEKCLFILQGEKYLFYLCFLFTVYCNNKILDYVLKRTNIIYSVLIS